MHPKANGKVQRMKADTFSARCMLLPYSELNASRAYCTLVVILALKYVPIVPVLDSYVNRSLMMEV